MLCTASKSNGSTAQAALILPWPLFGQAALHKAGPELAKISILAPAVPEHPKWMLGAEVSDDGRSVAGSPPCQELL